MKHVFEECKTHFIVAMKSNRLVARSEKDAQKKDFIPLEERWLGKRTVKLYLNGLDFLVVVVKKSSKTETAVAVRCTWPVVILSWSMKKSSVSTKDGGKVSGQ